MLRRILPYLAALFVAAPTYAACSLQMNVSCQTGANGAPSSCTATTLNTGSSSCTGMTFSAWFTEAPASQVSLSAPQTTLGGLTECFNSDDFGEFLEVAMSWCAGETSIGPGQSFTSNVDISGATADVPLIAITWVGTEEGEEIGSAYAFANVGAPTCIPIASAPPIAASGVEYTVSWTPISDPTAQFVIEESGSPDFTTNVTTIQVAGLSQTFHHDNMATATTYYYRIRATNCAGGTPGYSQTVQTVVQAETPVATERGEIAVPFGSTTPVSFRVRIPGAGPNTSFTATTDQPYFTVTPPSGVLPEEGIELTVSANPKDLPPGANTGTLIVSVFPTAAANVTTQATTPSTINIPITVSLVTPVAPAAKTLPPANALVIPVVTHVNGAAGQFLSDVRLTNAGSAPVNYQITMTPTQTDGRTSSKATQVTIAGQQTIALNDIVKNFFGYGATADPQDIGFGALEIRPLNASSSLTYASSRTYASTLAGTFGQFIAAMPFTRFATQRLSGIPLPGNPPTGVAPVLSLQQVAQSAKFRTNLGIVEGAGEPANGRIRIFNSLGTLLKEVPYALLPGEHRQLNRFIESQGIANLEDGRIEITVDSATGAVTAYASVLDNVTTDPLAVMPVEASKVSAVRYVVPGMAELPNGDNNFHSDLRVYNGGTTDVPVTIAFYPMGNGMPLVAQPQTIRGGEVLAIDNALPALFNATNTGGSIVIATPNPSSLVATGRTYTNVAGGGTYGQFIPGVTPEEGVGLGDRPLQVMQLEESAGFRSNLGLAELTGNAATVRLTLYLPDTKTSAITELTLAPNEFRQLRPILGMNPGKQTYNARITVEVIAGTGRVTAYGSVIDNESKDPTYVPAQ